MTASTRYQDRIIHVPSPWWGLLMLALLVAALGGAVVGGIYVWATTAPPPVTVPAVTDINTRAAEGILARHGLVARVATRRYDERVPADNVIAQAPAAGRTVRRGRVVELTVSDGPPWTRVPNLKELELPRAKDALTAADLRLIRISRRYSDDVPKDWVMDQQPAPGARVQRGERVRLFVSAGPKPQELAPQDLGEAKQAVVEVTLPPGDKESLVRIEVEDARGVSVPYSQWHQPGTQVSWVVTGYGDAVARVYVDGNLIEEKRF